MIKFTKNYNNIKLINKSKLNISKNCIKNYVSKKEIQQIVFYNKKN